MKITIDTKEDSPEEIRKAITFLHSLSNSGGGAYIPEANTPAADTTNLMSMFGDAPSTPAASETAPNFGSFLNLVDQKKEASKRYLDEPKLEFY
ncbi:MAG: hypothetical protein WCV90_08285 [Candidatus Woesearchaeota archaeon]|jgi:hypothetical protein